MVFIWCVIIMGRWGDHNYRHAGGVITGDAPKNGGGEHFVAQQKKNEIAQF
jgi:hypothetical protein